MANPSKSECITRGNIRMCLGYVSRVPEKKAEMRDHVRHQRVASPTRERVSFRTRPRILFSDKGSCYFSSFSPPSHPTAPQRSCRNIRRRTRRRKILSLWFRVQGCRVHLARLHDPDEPPPLLLIFNFFLTPLHVTGRPSTEYVSDETPMSTYANIHFAFEQMRVRALRDLHGSPRSNDDQHALTDPPRVLILGPENSGKTSIAKILINYAVRVAQNWSPLLVNLDPAQVRPLPLLRLSHIPHHPPGRVGSSGDNSSRRSQKPNRNGIPC